MGLYSTDTVLDQPLLFLQTNVESITVCSSQPANFSEAWSSGSGVVLCRTSSVTALTSADFSIGDSTRVPGGRALATPAVSGMIIETTSQASHIAMVNVTSSALLHIVKCTTINLAAGSPVNLPAFNIEQEDPTTDSLI